MVRRTSGCTRAWRAGRIGSWSAPGRPVPPSRIRRGRGRARGGLVRALGCAPGPGPAGFGVPGRGVHGGDLPRPGGPNLGAGHRVLTVSSAHRPTV